MSRGDVGRSHRAKSNGSISEISRSGGTAHLRPARLEQGGELIVRVLARHRGEEKGGARQYGEEADGAHGGTRAAVLETEKTARWPKHDEQQRVVITVSVGASHQIGARARARSRAMDKSHEAPPRRAARRRKINKFAVLTLVRASPTSSPTARSRHHAASENGLHPKRSAPHASRIPDPLLHPVATLPTRRSCARRCSGSFARTITAR